VKKNTSIPTTDFEEPFWKNSQFIAGVDEAGRGPLAGPVVAAAVVLPHFSTASLGFNDSKKLSEKQREELYEVIIAIAVDSAVSFVDSQAVDEINIRRATLKAMQRCVDSLSEHISHVFIDGNYFESEMVNFTTVVKGDAKVLSIAAASILAKVSRDRWMVEVADAEYPQYGFARHKGYGTREHVQSIIRYGACPLHRRTFLRNIIAENPQLELF
jgi:ribonuclease HII